MTRKTLSVSAIKEGTVIDHIPAGQALKIMRLLKLTKHKNQVSIGLNLSSHSMKYKDLIKIENRTLSERELHDIAIFAPNATINLIKESQVHKKINLALPESITDIISCPNSHCITHHEPIKSIFHVQEHRNKIFLQCKYCEKMYERDSIKKS